MRNCHYIDGQWLSGKGDPWQWPDAATQEVAWEGAQATQEEVDHALQAAREAFPKWSAAPYVQRAERLEQFRKQLAEQRDRVAYVIASDTGKPLWEARAEVNAMLSKIGLSKQAYEERRSPVIRHAGGEVHATRFKPHGVTAVLSPFNLPGHLAHAHIVPTLLAGNTVVWKPSEQAPRVAETLTQLWHDAGLPHGILNLVQGTGQTGRLITASPELDGLFFTGGFKTGKAIHRAFAEHPHKILAIEMGGNNPLVVWDVTDLDTAAYLTLTSAFITTGQRCTCARRLIVKRGESTDKLLDKLTTMVRSMRMGAYSDDPEPFMGPLISFPARERVLEAADHLRRKGAHPLLSMSASDSNRPYVTPGILDVTDVPDRPDQEIFGPLLQVSRVTDFDEAIREANQTAFGLAAGLLSDYQELFERFRSHVRAGIINWNTTTTGASGTMPFGGVGLSGNHRPSGYYASDYCSYPIACTEHHRLEPPEKLPPGLSLASD